MKKIIKDRKIFVSIICIILLIITYIVINYRELNAIYAMESRVYKEVENMKIVLGGEAVGIKLLATGVLVMGSDRTDTDLNVGDIILEVNGNKIETNIELVNFAKKSNGKKLNLKIQRKDEIKEVEITPQLDKISKEYKLGLWVKDSSAGVGTVTFYEKSTGKFASLGHGVTETSKNSILPITSGAITRTKIYSVKKGEVQSPGEIKGSITSDIIGDIGLNTEKGVYGYLYNKEDLKENDEIDIMPKTRYKRRKSIYILYIRR